jgi:hypothetical protein
MKRLGYEYLHPDFNSKVMGLTYVNFCEELGVRVDKNTFSKIYDFAKVPYEKKVDLCVSPSFFSKKVNLN